MAYCTNCGKKVGADANFCPKCGQRLIPPKESTHSRTELDEQEAAVQFVSYVARKTEDAWPTIHKNFSDFFQGKSVIEDERMAEFDLALAAIAQDLQVVKNIFAKDQAARIEKWVLKFLKCINPEDSGEYAVDEVKEYGKEFQKGIQNINAGGNPLSAIPARLIQRWLGKNIQNFDVEVNGKKTGIISPLLMMMITGVLDGFLGYWKRIKDNFELVEGPMSPEEFDEFVERTRESTAKRVY